jgi:hypothetical protein
LRSVDNVEEPVVFLLLVVDLRDGQAVGEQGFFVDQQEEGLPEIIEVY